MTVHTYIPARSDIMMCIGCVFIAYEEPKGNMGSSSNIVVLGNGDILSLEIAQEGRGFQCDWSRE